MILVKDGVEFTVIAPAGYVILDTLRWISAREDVNLTITSACDGVHSGPGDPHHTGEAYDIRTHDFDQGMKAYLVSTISRELGPKFYSFLESPGTDNEHIHAQRAKGTVYTVEDLLGRPV